MEQSTEDSSKAKLAGNGAEREQPERRFRELAEEWKAATAFLSSITEMEAHPAYQKIIGMGKEALPFLFEELRREPDFWFWALSAITGEDPVPEAARGNVRLMAKAWLTWAEEHGY
jgi:hypothetical protein